MTKFSTRKLTLKLLAHGVVYQYGDEVPTHTNLRADLFLIIIKESEIITLVIR